MPKPKILHIEKKLHVSKDMAERMSDEVSQNPHLYKNEQKQISEGELMRRAIDFYLSSVINRTIDKTA